MLRYLRIGTSAIALSALVAAPAVVFATAGPVEAQQNNGNGNGNAGGAGNGTNGNGNAFGQGGNSANGGFSHGDNAQSNNGNQGTGNNGNGNGNYGNNGNNGNGNAYGHDKDRSSPSTGGGIRDAGGGNNDGGDANAGFSAPDTGSDDTVSVLPRTTAFARVLETLFGAPAPGPYAAKASTTAENDTGSAPRTRTARISTTRAPAIEASIKPAVRPTVKGAMHPANLGTVTGVINASTKAKLDRIATGNFSGPAGLAAALAIADYTMQALQEDLDVAKETLALAAAYDLVRNAPSATEIANAQALLDNGIDDRLLDDQARSTLGYPDLGPANQVISRARANGTDQPGTAELTRAAVVVNQLVDARTAITHAEEKILSAYSGALDASPETAEKVIEAVRLANPSREQIEESLPAPESLTAGNEPARLSPAERRLINSLAGRFGNS